MTDIHESPATPEDPKSSAGAFGFGQRLQTNRRNFLALSGLAVGGVAIGVSASACGTAQTGNQQGGGNAKGRPGASGETLFVAGFQWGPPTSFNPVMSRSGARTA